MKMKRVFCMLLMTGMTLDAQVDYQTQVQTIFNGNCTECHGNTSGVSLNTYQQTMASVGTQYMMKVVVPGDKDSSPLFDKISPGPAIGGWMPKDRAPLDTPSINTIGQWIDEGATETVTGIDAVFIPQQFEISGCFPNPFNPVTTLRFELPVSASVVITIVNVQGRIVFRAAGSYAQGSHESVISLNDQPSGIYFARLTAMTHQGARVSGAVKLTLIE